MSLIEVEVESLFRKCRFCLSDLTKNDKVFIDASLKEKFEELTQTEVKQKKIFFQIEIFQPNFLFSLPQLTKSKIYSKFICSLCKEHFDFSYNFVSKLIEQQKHCLILEESLQSSDPNDVKLERR